MKNASKKAMMLGFAIAIVSLLAGIPLAKGYGLDFGSAETITTGTHSDYLYSSDYRAYYKISCNQGQHLSVTLTYSSASPDYDLMLYDTNQNFISEDDSGMSKTSLSVQTICSKSGYYYIKVWENGVGDQLISLNVQQTTAMVPGYDVTYTLLSIISALGILVLVKMRRIRSD
jgi:hypothetical protein